MSNLSVTSSLAAPVYANPLTRPDAENIQQNELTAGVSRSAQTQTGGNNLDSSGDRNGARGDLSDRNEEQAPFDEDTPTGPPPSFEASLLDVQTDFDNIIKRIEAARELEKTAEAVRAEPTLTSDSTDTDTNIHTARVAPGTQ